MKGLICGAFELTGSYLQRECLKEWAHEIHHVSGIVWKTLFVKLPGVEAIHK
jgi:hypothetical protein